MTLEGAIEQVQGMISAACPGADVKIARISGEEARLSVYAPAVDIQKIKDAVFQPAIDLLNRDGLDVQVFVYDRDAPPLKG